MLSKALIQADAHTFSSLAAADNKLTSLDINSCTKLDKDSIICDEKVKIINN